MASWQKILLGREKDERVNIFGFVPAAEKQRVRQLHAAERTAKATEAVARNRGKATSSVADEIAKLVKLRDAGELTQAEFKAQKAKLLA